VSIDCDCVGRGVLSGAEAEMPQTAEEEEICRLRRVYHCRDSYHTESYGLCQRSNVLQIEEVQREMQFLISRRIGPDLSKKRILEVGCGSGYWLRQFIQWGARPENLSGIDLIPERIAKARELCPTAVYVQCTEASKLGFDCGSFDMVLQSTVFTSILDTRMKEAVAAQIIRVLKPGGCLLWYDFFVDNPWNPDVKGLRKAEIVHLFPGCRIELRRVTVAPPLGRILAVIAPLMYYAASSVKICCTHYLGVIDKP